MRILSKTIIIMFLFDFLMLLFLTSFWYQYFNLDEKFYFIITLLTVIMGLCVLFLKSNYRVREFNINFKNSYLLFEGVILAHIPAIILMSIFVQNMKALQFTFLNIITIYLTLQIYRILFHLYLFKIKPYKNILIIGTNKNAKYIADEIINKKALRMNIIGFLEDTEPDEDIINDNNYKVFKQPLKLSNIINLYNVDIVILAVNREIKEDLLSDIILGTSNEIRFYKMQDFYEMITYKYYIDESTINNLFLEYMNERSNTYNICKRIFDIISALIILTVTFPILLYVGIRVKLTDGGNAIYTQTRIGRGAKPFKMYKLRTMYKNDYVPKDGNIEHSEGQDNDSRVIPFCKFIRKARFDEIPQMINILRGEMSIVGPRAEWEDLVKIYSNQIPFYNCRQWVKTGWTGWAQINQGHCVLNDDIAEKLQYDLYYLKHRNILWEAGILVKAIFLALGGRHG